MMVPRGLLGRSLDLSQPIHIVGAGISGLMLGWWLRRAGAKIHISEKTDRAGGLLQSLHTKYGLVERAANGVLWNDALDLMCSELGVEPLSPRKEAKKTISRSQQSTQETTAQTQGITLASERNVGYARRAF